MSDALLTINDYATWVHLGCSEEEKFHRQEIRVSIQFAMESLPPACQSDDLNETICYAKACSMVDEICQARPFHLVEKIAGEIHSSLNRVFADKDLSIAVKVHKLHPPIERLNGGVNFQIGKFQ